MLKRKKFAAPPARSACLMCRAARVRCSGDSPCTRCRKKNQTCTFKPSRRGLKRSVPDSTTTDDAACTAEESHDISTPVVISDMSLEPQQDGFNDLEDVADPGLLPTLYSDDLDSFQFDQMFTGDSDEALDRFFADIFCLPSFPQSESLDPMLLLTDNSTPPWSALQEYRSDADVLRAYYRLIHPVFPILPPPNADSLETHLDGVYEPSSPLILSLLSILFLRNEPNSPDGLATDATQRMSLAGSFAQCAAEACEISLNTQAISPLSFLRLAAHPNVPADFEVPLAFCVLSLYQYLHCGNIKEMIRFAEKAVDSSIKLLLHKQDDEAGGLATEAMRRAWWMTYLCVCHASTVSCKPPVRPINLKDVQTPFPTSLYRPGVWDRYIHAEETLVAATLLLVALVKGFHSEAATPSFRQSLNVLDNLIKSQLSQLTDARPVGLVSDDSPESRLADCLHNITRMRLMSAHIKTHRYRALMEYPGILEKFEAFPPLDVSDRPPSGHGTPRSHATEKANQIFPFTSLYSLQICFDSTIGIGTCIDSLNADFSMAPFACSAIIAGYTALMILHFHNPATRQAWPRVAADDLRERCKATVTATLRGLRKYSVGFPFMATLTDDLQKAAAACDVSTG